MPPLRPRTRRRARLRLTRLEDRTLPAGGLTAVVTAGVLRVTDWQAGEVIAVHQAAAAVSVESAGVTQVFVGSSRVWLDVQWDARVVNDAAGPGGAAARPVQVARRDATGARFTATVDLAPGAWSGPAGVTPPAPPAPPSPPPSAPFDWFGAALQDAGLRTLARVEAGDGVLDRADVLHLLALAQSDGTVSAAEFHDLGTLLHPARVTFGTGPGYALPDPVRVLMTDVVDGTAANKLFQGAALGNLHAGSAADQLNKLVGKWFFGMDHPRVRAGETYRLVGGALFQGGPAFRDVDQGSLGDCYFVAALAEVAQDRPQAIKDLFTDNGDGTFTVRFFDNGVADYVTVDRFLPTDAAGHAVYAGFGGGRSDSTGNELWVALAEKAYAQINEEGWLGHAAANAYSAIDGGFSDLALKHIAGGAAGWTWITAATANQLLAAVAAARPTVLGSKESNPGNGVVDGHGYALVGYNAATRKFTLYNPWGSTIDLTWAQIQASFNGFWQSA
jgi:hypothetical protein